jgi:pimeloyl-ACP methyl ester carboxylesterase
MSDLRSGSVSNRFSTPRLSRRQAIARGAATIAAGAVISSGSTHHAYAQEATPHPVADDVAELVDIGGRAIFMETHGSGAPTVVFVSGYRASGMYWTDDLIQPEAPRTMVMAGVSEFAHAVAYDRPGTYAPDGPEDIIVSRSEAIAQPRTAMEVVEELHQLLQAAGVSGPYVLAGHSLGGFFARLYASTYPDDVVGMVLVDAYSERLETLLSPDDYERLKKLNQSGGTDTVFPIPDYGDVETLPWGGDNDVMREAAAATPLRPMPLAVLAHGLPFSVPEESGFTSEELEPLLRAANENLATLVPNARFFVAADSGHDIHQDQPQLVIEAIRQVVEGVRAPETWYSLTTLPPTL